MDEPNEKKSELEIIKLENLNLEEVSGENLGENSGESSESEISDYDEYEKCDCVDEKNGKAGKNFCNWN